MRATDSVALVVCLCFADSLDDGDKLYLRNLKDAREDDASCGVRASISSSRLVKLATVCSIVPSPFGSELISEPNAAIGSPLASATQLSCCHDAVLVG